jgi:hypothetical protein
MVPWRGECFHKDRIAQSRPMSRERKAMDQTFSLFCKVFCITEKKSLFFEWGLLNNLIFDRQNVMQKRHDLCYR